MFDSPGNPENVNDQEISGLKAIALNILEQMPGASSLTTKQKQALTIDAVLYCTKKDKNPSDFENIKTIISARIQNTLRGVLYETENNHDAIRKGPTNSEQMQRHNLLLAALEMVKNSPKLQHEITAKTIDFLNCKPQSLNGFKHRLTQTQTEDIVANFIHHAFNNKMFFTTEDALAVFTKIYLETETDEVAFEHAKRIFMGKIKTLFNHFLASPNIKETRITSKEAANLTPKTTEQKELIKWDYVLLQHGNLNSRNTAILSLRQFIKTCIRGIFRKNSGIRKDYYEDLCQTVEEKLIEKLYLYDAKLSSPITFFRKAIQRLAYRELNSMDLVRQPFNVHYERYLAQKYPEYQQTCKEPVHLKYIDQMFGKSEDSSLLDSMPALHNNETPEDEIINNDLHEKFMRIISSLPQRSGDMMRERAGGATFATISEKYGISRARAEQIVHTIRNMKKMENLRREYISAS